jgi:2-methylcitrate dehydratase PrpD
VSIKPYASCLYTHPVIDGVIRIRDCHRVAPDDVASLTCEVSKFCHSAACVPEPLKTGLEGKFSTSFCAALALKEGRAGEDQFTDLKVGEPSIRSLMERITVKKNEALSDAEAVVTLRFRDGREAVERINGPLGDPDHPLTDRQVEDKFKSLLNPLFETKRIDQILDRLWHIEDLDDISALLPLSVIDGGERRGTAF